MAQCHAMNIMQVISSSRTSGAERHMVILCDGLRKRGHNVTAICPPGGWISRQLSEAGIPTMEWPMHGWRAPSTVVRLKTFMRENRVQLVHTHLTRATYMGYMAGVAAHVPVVTTMHTLNRDWAYRYLSRRTHWFIAVSRDLERAMVKRGVPPDRVRVVYNGTDMRGPSGESDRADVRQELGMAPDAILFGVFSRVDEFKGQHILVRGAKEIVEACPSAQFLFVGHASPLHRQRLLEIARRDDLEDRLHFTGVRDDVPRLLASTDVAVLTSVTEACSMAIIEAMTMGKPVIATRAGGNPELVIDGENGILVDRTPEDVARAAITLGGDAALRQRMGAAGRERGLKLFTADRMVTEIERFYRDVLRPVPLPLLRSDGSETP